MDKNNSESIKMKNIAYDFDYRKALIDKIELENSSEDLKYELLDDYIDYVQEYTVYKTAQNLFGCSIFEMSNEYTLEYLKQSHLTVDNCTVIGDISELNDTDSTRHWFIVDCGNNDVYLYQDWEQVWENIIYDLLPDEWLTSFVLES